MSNEHEVPLTSEELMESLQDQISNLIDFCKDYDLGKKIRAKPISSILRNLLHNPARKQGGIALLTQLSMLEVDWFDFSHPVPVMQAIDTCTLVNWAIYNGNISVEPNTYLDYIPRVMKIIDWWNEPVANSLLHGTYSRKELVLGMADKEGSHVDPSLHKKYIALREGTFVSNITAVGSNGDTQTFKDVHNACIRAIAHEALLTLQKNFPQAFIHPYTFINPKESARISWENSIEEKYVKALDLDQNNVDLMSDYAIFLTDIRKDYLTAAKVYDLALKANPIHFNCLNNYANLLNVFLKDLFTAEALYIRALEVKPNDANALGNYALLLSKIPDKHDTAENYFKLALKIDPLHENNLGNYALFLTIVRRDHVAAEIFYKRALEINPNHLVSLANYANILSDKGDYDSAELLYKRVTGAYPKHVNSLNNYAVFLENIRKNNDEAESFYKRAIEVNPNDVNSVKNYSNFLSKKRNKK